MTEETKYKLNLAKQANDELTRMLCAVIRGLKHRWGSELLHADLRSFAEEAGLPIDSINEWWKDHGVEDKAALKKRAIAALEAEGFTPDKIERILSGNLENKR